MSSVNLGTVSVANNAGGLVNLNLLAPFTNSNGTYYFVDVDGNGQPHTAGGGGGDELSFNQISSVFGGSTSGNFNGYTLSVPSLSEFQAIGSVPSGWGAVAPAYTYWTSDGSTIYGLGDNKSYSRSPGEGQYFAVKAVQLPLRIRCLVLFLP